MNSVNSTALSILWPSETSPQLRVPLFADPCAAGFPSPAQDYVESELDLNELCIRRQASTFFVRASGSSMQELGLFDGDVMVVNRAEEALHGDIVIAEVNGEFTVKRLQLQPCIALLPMNSAYSAIYPEELQLMGVVTWFLQQHARASEVIMSMFGLADVNSFYASCEALFRPDLRGNGNTAFVKLRVGTQDTRNIIGAAVKSLDTIWRPGYRYAKAGIMLSELRPNGVAQLNLFDDGAPRAGSKALMSLMDSMNRSGRYSIGFAGKGIDPDWKMKREMLSKAWTTNWKELPVAKLI